MELGCGRQRGREIERERSCGIANGKNVAFVYLKMVLAGLSKTSEGDYFFE